MQRKNKESSSPKIGSMSLFAFVLFAMLGVLVKICFIQYSDAEDIKKLVDSKYRTNKVKAARGNLFATDGTILATTVMRYDIYVDFKTMRDTLFKNNVDALADSLGEMFNKPKSYFLVKLNKERSRKNQYYRLITGLEFDKYARIRSFPIFNKGKSKGGFIVERKYHRELATSEIGAGTIGVDDERGHSGLEAAFSKYLRGKDGSREEQKINSKQWKPINYWKTIDPVDGNDVYTTLDLRIQDIASSALEKQLAQYKAHHGSVIVIEVATGKVRAMVNLTKTKDGSYKDTYNYALKDATEQGSTFKVVSLLAGMDDGFIDDNTTVDVENGTWVYGGQKISDGHGGGLYDISDVLANSSNVGTAKLITKYYKDSPNTFLNHLRRWKMAEKLDLEVSGVASPKIITPKNKSWNRATLASISYGYSTNFSLIQMATFYNAIANKGKMLKPIFIDKVLDNGKIIYEAKPQVMVEKIASDKAIDMMTRALVKAVEKGTAKSIFTPNLKMAGKTGTARFEYWIPGTRKYQASFAGFYPADKPLYTCLVMINQPDTSIGYYGSTVSAPVFKEIAGRTFLKMPQNIDINPNTKPVDLKKLIPKQEKISVKNNIMPNIIGSVGAYTISQLENEGYRVKYEGVGRVKEQFPIPDTKLKKGQRIYLVLDR